MKISYVTIYDALDIHKSSGIGYHIAKALEQQGNKIDYIGNLFAKKKFSMKLKSLFLYLIGKWLATERSNYIARQYANQISMRIKSDSDIIFSPGSIPIALLETKKPKVIYTDATFAGMLGFYDEFSSYCNQTIKEGNYLEQKALEESKLIIYSSDWAAATAIKNYKVNPDKIKVVPFGASVENVRTFSDIKNIVKLKSKTKCKLFFMGVDWIRKGGDLAINVAEKLNKRGLVTELHIASAQKLPIHSLPSFVINHGFISKATEEGRNKINQLMAQSHFLILPSKADCTPLVFPDANSFGLPCITTNVGGIPTIIKDDINGKIFSPSTKADEYVNCIETLFTDSSKYEQLAYSSFEEYQKRLNWNVAGNTIMSLLKEL